VYVARCAACQVYAACCLPAVSQRGAACACHSHSPASSARSRPTYLVGSGTPFSAAHTAVGTGDGVEAASAALSTTQCTKRAQGLRTPLYADQAVLRISLLRWQIRSESPVRGESLCPAHWHRTVAARRGGHARKWLAFITIFVFRRLRTAFPDSAETGKQGHPEPEPLPRADSAGPETGIGVPWARDFGLARGPPSFRIWPRPEGPRDLQHGSFCHWRADNRTFRPPARRVTPKTAKSSSNFQKKCSK
jgi:hypothetical protein